MHPWLEMPERAADRIVRFLREYLDAAGADGYVLGMSGGLDSAVVAVLAARAAPGRCVGVALPSRASEPADLELARVAATHAGIPLVAVEIGPPAEALVDSLGRAGTQLDRAARGNLTARMRMAALHAVAAARGGLVAGTGNKSELYLGYFTKHGDGGVDVQPIGDLYKTQLRRLGAELAIPVPILDRPPSAGLWPGQTDEQELGLPYAKLDLVLAGIERSLPFELVAAEAGVELERVAQVHERVVRSQHKRAPPSVPKLGIRTPGVDLRLPVMTGRGRRGS